LARTFIKFERFIFGSGGGIKPAGTKRGWVRWGRKGGGGGRKGRWSVFGYHKHTDSLSLSSLSFLPNPRLLAAFLPSLLPPPPSQFLHHLPSAILSRFSCSRSFLA
jgi:hypothetical protein